MHGSVYSQVNEIIKRLSVAERMGELWASGSHAASALRTLEGRGVCSDVFNLRTVTLFMDCPGCAWACDLRLSIWFCEGIVADTWHMHFGVSHHQIMGIGVWLKVVNHMRVV